MQVNIPDSRLQHFTENAKLAFEKKVMEDADKLIDESHRIEAGKRKSHQKPEITESIIDASHAFLNYSYNTRKKTKKNTALKVISAISSLLTGAIFDFNSLTNPVYVFFIILIFTIAIGTTFYTILIGDEYE